MQGEYGVLLQLVALVGALVWKKVAWLASVGASPGNHAHTSWNSPECCSYRQSDAGLSRGPVSVYVCSMKVCTCVRVQGWTGKCEAGLAAGWRAVGREWVGGWR